MVMADGVWSAKAEKPEGYADESFHSKSREALTQCSQFLGSQGLHLIVSHILEVLGIGGNFLLRFFFKVKFIIGQ